MGLLNLGFAFLVVRITICVAPALIGIYLISMSEESKRSLRNSLCNRLLGVSNAIPYPNFERMLIISGVVGILISGLATWFLLLRKFF